MNGDGSDVRRLTNRPGPDGGPWFSPDGKQIVFRGRRSPTRRSSPIIRPAEGRPLAADDARDLRDEPRRQQSAAGHAGSAAPTSRRPGIRTASASSSRRTSRTRRAATSTSSSINLDGIRPRAGHVQLARSTASRCSRRTARGWCSARTGTRRRKARRTSLSRTGSTEIRHRKTRSSEGDIRLLSLLVSLTSC